MSPLNKRLLFEDSVKKLIGFKVTKLYKQKFFNIIKNLDDMFIIEFNGGYFIFHIQCIMRIRKNGNIILTSNDEYLDSDYKDLENIYNDNELYNNNLLKLNLELVFNELNKYSVIDCKMNELGDLSIHFEDDYVIDIFVDVPKNGELYRFISEELSCVLEQKNGTIKCSTQKCEV